MPAVIGHNSQHVSHNLSYKLPLNFCSPACSQPCTLPASSGYPEQVDDLFCKSGQQLLVWSKACFATATRAVTCCNDNPEIVAAEQNLHHLAVLGWQSTVVNTNPTMQGFDQGTVSIHAPGALLYQISQLSRRHAPGSPGKAEVRVYSVLKNVC